MKILFCQKERSDMIKIIDTYSQIKNLFSSSSFHYTKWKAYINSIYPGSSVLFENDIAGYFENNNYTFEKDFLPIINAVHNHPDLTTLHESFLLATHELNKKIVWKFHRELDIDIVLYLGLCNGAGWVTTINDTNTILLGIEKILELGWYSPASMYGLIYHELGHVYHNQYGHFHQTSEDSRKNFVWQLFTEGIAMYFEQLLIDDPNFYHQDTNGWKNWYDLHFVQLLTDFDHDISITTHYTQRFFGDWSDYCGHADTGYYLGCRFIHFLKNTYSFDQLICLDIDTVYVLYLNFVQKTLSLKH